MVWLDKLIRHGIYAIIIWGLWNSQIFAKILSKFIKGHINIPKWLHTRAMENRCIAIIGAQKMYSIKEAYVDPAWQWDIPLHFKYHNQSSLLMNIENVTWYDIFCAVFLCSQMHVRMATIYMHFILWIKSKVRTRIT